MASDILCKAYEINQENAKMLVIKEIPEIGNATCLQIASISGQQNFISNKCVQDLLVKIWYHKMSPDTSKFFVIDLVYGKTDSITYDAHFFLLNQDYYVLAVSSDCATRMQFERERQVVPTSSKQKDKIRPANDHI